MSMNKTGIESWDYSWNPISGCDNDPHCPYCYAEPITVRYAQNYPMGFKPFFYLDRITDPQMVKKPARVFTGSMGDMFCPGMKQEWIRAVFDVMARTPRHKFFILTKNPNRVKEALSFTYGSPIPNVWLGVTVEDQEKVWRIDALRDNAPGWNKFISFEPLLGPVTYLHLDEIKWALIGAMTGRYAKTNVVNGAWVKMLSNIIKANDVPLFIKDSLEDYCNIPGPARIPFYRELER
jgi:protein gp37